MDQTIDDAETAAAEAFIERMGFIVQAEGLPRIAGRVLGLLILEGGPIGFADLAARLQVSRASVSTNTRLLEGLGVVERTARPGERGDSFRLADRPWRRLLEGSVERMGRVRETVAKTRKAMPADAPAQGRLKELGDFYAVVEAQTRALLDRL